MAAANSVLVVIASDSGNVDATFRKWGQMCDPQGLRQWQQRIQCSEQLVVLAMSMLRLGIEGKGIERAYCLVVKV